jgi:hypothetical protein
VMPGRRDLLGSRDRYPSLEEPMLSFTCLGSTKEHLRRDEIATTTKAVKENRPNLNPGQGR